MPRGNVRDVKHPRMPETRVTWRVSRVRSSACIARRSFPGLMLQRATTGIEEITSGVQTMRYSVLPAKEPNSA